MNELILEQALETHENNFQKKDNISLDTGDFYNYKEVANFPSNKVIKIKTTKSKAA